MKKNEYIELARKELHHLKHKDLLKKAFRDEVYTSVYGLHLYRYKEPLDSFLHITGTRIESIPTYVQMLDDFLEAVYSEEHMEKKILEIFTSIPLTSEGEETIFNIFGGSLPDGLPLFSEFEIVYKKSKIITELFDLGWALFTYYPCGYRITPKEFLEALRVYYKDYPNTLKWEKFVDYHKKFSNY